VFFDLEAPGGGPERFYDFPFPSDIRLIDGRPDLASYPNPGDIKLLADLVPLGEGREGWSLTSASYFRFTAPLPALVETEVFVGPDADILMIDIDADSPERGKLIPVVARTIADDDYAPANVLAVAPVPGFVLAGNRQYATVIRESLGDAEGEELGVPGALRKLRRGQALEGDEGARVTDLYAPLWETLEQSPIDAEEVAAATVFTTGDVVSSLADLSEKVRERFSVSLGPLQVDPDDGDHERFCELVGTVSFPQFQTGAPPFQAGGVFETDAEGLPVLQRMEDAEFVITLPKGPMPAGGYPLTLYFHGSGGLSQQVVDRGRIEVAGGTERKGEGPAYVLAPHGFATVGSALPVNPERLEGASDYEYLNLNNLASLPFTFAQGAIEQRLLLDALLGAEIPPSAVAGCTGLELPVGETGYRFASEKVVAMGQSMGGNYTSIVGAIDPRVRAVVPTGGGGLWHYYILSIGVVPDAKGLFSVVLRTPQEELTFLHPALQLLNLAWEMAEPMVYMRRLGQDPLPEHPSRPIYQPVGEGDSYFTTEIYDAAALASGNTQAGEEVWASMQENLALDDRDGLVPYPVRGNLEGPEGDYTGAIVQYEGDGIHDPHSIYTQLDSVKHQYGCFLQSFVERGEATLPAPAALGTPCP
jgi:hypothetical protein